MQKTVITYYGGKQQMASDILARMPQHKTYVEPFFGGGAVFWRKPDGLSEAEVINDRNSEVYNFWLQCRENFEALRERVECTLYSRVEHRRAEVMYLYPDCFSALDRAWAFFVQTNMSFSSTICGGWAFDSGGKTTKAFRGKVGRFDERIAERLANVQIENKDALDVIMQRDAADAFFYVDPPYPNSHQGHYAGYTMQDFLDLLEVLKKVQGRFMLSSYQYPELKVAAKAMGWRQETFEKTLSAAKSRLGGSRKTKTEVLTMNY